MRASIAYDFALVVLEASVVREQEFVYGPRNCSSSHKAQYVFTTMNEFISYIVSVFVAARAASLIHASTSFVV